MTAKILSLVLAGVAWLSVSCASHGQHEVRTTPRNQFYCHHCAGYHPYSHSHYRVYYNSRYESPRHHHHNHHRHYDRPRSSSTIVIDPPGPLPPPPRPPHPFRD